jgi:putative nucleotidyltransferase with HDIG domain
MDNAVFNMLYRLMQKDVVTYEHSVRLGKMAKMMAGYLHFTPQETHDLVTGCLLHDIGKIVIPDKILMKESSLTVAEWETMSRHPALGAHLAAQDGNVSQTVIEIIKYHHERWDGAGYPYGLRGDHIPSFARICSIIDAFDSMVYDRPYRKGVSIQEAKDELWSQSKKQFDPNLVQLFLHIPEQQILCEDDLPLHFRIQRKQVANLFACRK